MTVGPCVFSAALLGQGDARPVPRELHSAGTGRREFGTTIAARPPLGRRGPARRMALVIADDSRSMLGRARPPDGVRVRRGTAHPKTGPLCATFVAAGQNPGLYWARYPPTGSHNEFGTPIRRAATYVEQPNHKTTRPPHRKVTGRRVNRVRARNPVLLSTVIARPGSAQGMPPCATGSRPGRSQDSQAHGLRSCRRIELTEHAARRLHDSGREASRMSPPERLPCSELPAGDRALQHAWALYLNF
jgi:hypothetical protein